MDTAITQSMTDAEKKRLYKKVLWRLLGAVGLLYCFFGLDNLLVGYAALTMRADLNINDTAYGIIRSAGFLAAFLFQIPYNITIKKVGAQKLLPTVAIIWSLTSLLLFFANSPVQVAISRFFNGIGDAGYFVCVMYWITLWLPSHERATFSSIFIATGSVTAIVGSPICGLIVDNINWLGLPGWRWLFLLPSALSLVIALVGYVLIKNRPEDAKWLNDRERDTIAEDLAYEQEVLADKEAEPITTTAAEIKHAFANKTLWMLGFTYFFFQMAMLTCGSWMTMIIQGFAPGITGAEIGYISAAPALLSIVFSILVSKNSDKTKERKWHMIFPVFCGALSFLLFTLPIGLWAKIIVLGILGSFGLSSWYGPFWTLPAALLPASISNIGIAVICCMSSLSGFLGNLIAGVISEQFGHVGLLLFFALAVFLGIAMSFTLDYKKVALVDKGKAVDEAKENLV